MCRSLAFGLGLVLVGHIVFARFAIGQEQRVDFDIPAQPLASALEQYSNITGRNALYHSNLMVGRRSTAVHGPVLPDAALTTLLEGTGLSVSHATPSSFVLLPTPVIAATVPTAAVTQYYGRIQASLQKALCADGDARPGGYRIALRLWIDSVGNVTRFERLGSSGTSSLDDGIDRTLRHLQIGMSPPAGLGQPVSIVILPQAPGVTMGCEGSATRPARTTP